MFLNAIKSVFIILLLLWGPCFAWAQSEELTNKIIAEASAHCKIDASANFYTLTVTGNDLTHTNSNAEAYLDFHNAHVLWQKHQLNEAFDACNKAIVTVHDGKGRYLALLMKARILFEKNLYDKTIAVYQEALQLSRNTSFPLQLLTLSNLANVLVDQQKYRPALQYFTEWLRKENPNEDIILKGHNYHNIGLCYLHLEKYDSAATFLKKGLAVREKIGDTLGIAASYMDLANLYYMQYKDAEAIPLFEKGLRFAILSGDVRVMRNAYLNMAVVEENRKDHKKSLGYRKEYEKLQDSLWNRDRVWEIAEKEKQFAVSIKETQVKLLEQEKKLGEAELKTQNRQRNMLFFIAIAFLVLSGVVYLAYKQSQDAKSVISAQRNELDELNQTKDLLFSIIAHDLRSPIFSLKKAHQRLPKVMAAGNEEQFKKIVAANESTIDKIYLLLNNLLYWALDQTNRLHFTRERTSLHAIVTQVHYDFLSAIEEKNILFENHVSIQSFIYADQNTFKIALRNLLDNAVKFTPPNGKISISETINSSTHAIILKDSGLGIPENKLGVLFEVNREKLQADTHQKTSTGLGLILCKTMIEKNGARLEITSKPNEGATCTIYFPVTEDGKDTNINS